MSPSLTFSLTDVLAVARIHPFYTSDAQYPPDADVIHKARARAALSAAVDLKAQPLLRKKDLYATIERLVDDTSPQNTYRRNIYTSITGGGSSGSKELFFATDSLENRRHRAYFGQFLRTTGLIQDGDWVLSTHWGGELYRSLDLILEIMENAGASTLAAGSHMSPSRVVQLLADYHVNVLAGDGSQVVQVVHHISTLSAEERSKIKLDKIIYTSEALTKAQKSHIKAVLGSAKICSVLGSAEAGPYAVSTPDLTLGDGLEGYSDFVFDTRMTLMEVLPLAAATGDDGDAEPLLDGETGTIALTSLTRLRNPVVRYMTGDIGSLHGLPEQARSVIPEADWPFLRILRLQGRDRRFSFNWDGCYLEYETYSALMSTASFGILQWQVILDVVEPSKAVLLDVRMLRSGASEVPKQDIVDRIRDFFHVNASNENRMRVTFVEDLNGFELSRTGHKVVKFIDRSD